MNDVRLTSRGEGRFPEIEALIAELTALREEILSFAQEECSTHVAEAHPTFRQSALNLLHYLAMRRRDLRQLELKLSIMGLSSLGGAESHVIATINAVLILLHELTGHAFEIPPEENVVNFETGRRLLAEHTKALLGNATDGRNVRIMVTMPSQAASDYTLVCDLLEKGMNVVRINCAHDHASAWLSMIKNLRRAEKSLGQRCEVLMDLAGPKLRTGSIEKSEYVLEIRPANDNFGEIVAPARVWLTTQEAPFDPPTEAIAVLQFPSAWLKRLKKGDKINFTDAGNSHHTLEVVATGGKGCWAELTKTALITTETIFRTKNTSTEVTALPEAEASIKLQKGDLLVLTRDAQPGHAASYDANGDVLTPATIGCTIPEVFDDARVGESIWFDDGEIGGVLEKIEPERVFVRITQARPKGEKLRGYKGINLPDSNFKLAALTEKDLEDLPFVVEHADLVAMSFAGSAEDVETLQEHIAKLGKNRPAIVLKIETRDGFENLPQILLSAMKTPPCGVMIARGDLAVECGFERLAEVQEEILSVCEAAHVPVIWATQVLESLAKKGFPSRAEITDAAMGHRAECVMLNKGEHIVAAVEMLDDILRRMQAHQSKKSPMLHGLRPAPAETPANKSSAQ